MRGSLSSGEYPLFASGQDLTTYLVHSVNVKFAKGLQTALTVPEFTGYDTVNVVELDGSFYWVTAWKEATTLNGTVTMTLDYMAPTSLLKSGSSLTGIFQKTATNECPYLKQEITNGLKLIESSLEPSNLEIGTVFKESGTYGHEEVGYWVQVTGFKRDTLTDEPYITRVGFPIGVRTDTSSPSANKIRDVNASYWFPRYGDLIRDITACTGIQADQVIDCSVSKRCPYVFRKTKVNVSATRDIWYFEVMDTEGSPVPTQLMSDNQTVVYVLGTRNLSAQYAHASQTVTISLDTSYKRQCASIQIRDWNENAVMEIPVDGASISIRFDVVDDESGIYTIASHGDQEICLTEGKLPYVENTWETYKAYQMDTDRMSMENAIRFAEYQRDTQRIAGTANSAISGATSGLMAGFISGSGAGAAALAVGGAIAGAITDLYTQDRAMELARLQAQADMELSKRSAIDQPNTGYNVAYGMIYISLNQRNTLRACVVLPYDVDSTYYTAFVGEFGYPAEGRRTISIANGYYRGKAISTSTAESGMYWDRMNEIFEKGFKFISPGA